MNAQKSDANHSPQNQAIDRYIRTIIHMRMRDIGQRTLQERIADAITTFSGTMTFVYIHIVWFIGWILANTGLFSMRPFDPFPYGLLTMVVSLEAIFLSTFVLISQNRLTEHAEHRSDLDLHIDLLTEYELTRVLQMLHGIEDKLGIENTQDVELTALEKETDPEAILDKIELLQGRTMRRRQVFGDKGMDKDEEKDLG
jgi:uncharacterized membrane protein